MLAVTRFISIVSPFFRVSNSITLGYITVYAIVMAGLNLSTMFCKMLPAPKGLGPNLSRVCLMLNVSQCLLGICASLFTVLEVMFRKRLTEAPDKRTRSSVTILLMNLPYIVSVVLILVTLTGISGIRFALLTFPTVATITSMLNPLTILLLNHRARRYTRQAILRRGHALLSVVVDLKPLVHSSTTSTGFLTNEHQNNCNPAQIILQPKSKRDMKLPAAMNDNTEHSKSKLDVHEGESKP
jgi:hypothetical protein